MRLSANTFYDAKRLLGRKKSERVVKEDQTYWPFEIDDDGKDSPVFSSSKFGKITPKEICKKIINVLWKAAES